MLQINGPCDDPAYLCRMAMTFKEGGFWRQAGQALERAIELAPEGAEARFELVNAYCHCRMSEAALRTLEEIRTHPDWLGRINHAEAIMTLFTAQAWYAAGNQFKAEAVLQPFIEAHASDQDLLDLTRKVFMGNKSYDFARWAADLRLKLTPDAVPAMMDKALSHIQLGQFSNAVPVLTRVISLTNSPEALYFRAEAYTGMTNLEAASADFQELLRAVPGSAEAYEGLAEVARRKGATNEAIHYYQQCLASATAGSAGAKIIAARLQELQPRMK